MKTVIVTGGSRGIGAAIVKELASSGYNVVLNYNKSEEAAKNIQKELKEININIEIFKADVSKRDEVKELIKFTLEKYISEINFIEDGFLYNYINNVEESTIEKIDNNKYKLHIKNKNNTTFEINEIINI